MGRRMAKGISDEKKLYVVEMLEKGCTYRQISQDLGVSNQAIADIKREFFGDDKMRKSIVAGDKFNGLLECVGKNQFKGSVRVKGGKFETKRFTTSSRQEAEKLWNEWKEEVLKDQAPEIINPPIVVTRGNNKHSYIPTNPTDRNHDIIEVEIPNDPIEVAIPKIEEAKVEDAPMVADGGPDSEDFHPIYLLAVGYPRIAGYSYNAEDARKMMRVLNYALETAGVDIRYSVVEIKCFPKNADVIGG